MLLSYNLNSNARNASTKTINLFIMPYQREKMEEEKKLYPSDLMNKSLDDKGETHTEVPKRRRAQRNTKE
jgi:hypothetical protein